MSIKLLFNKNQAARSKNPAAHFIIHQLLFLYRILLSIFLVKAWDSLQLQSSKVSPPSIMLCQQAEAHKH